MIENLFAPLWTNSKHHMTILYSSVFMGENGLSIYMVVVWVSAHFIFPIISRETCKRTIGMG